MPIRGSDHVLAGVELGSPPWRGDLAMNRTAMFIQQKAATA
jgi:hypothetical protein